MFHRLSHNIRITRKNLLIIKTSIFFFNIEFTKSQCNFRDLIQLLLNYENKIRMSNKQIILFNFN